ncbi:hypothetical protein PENTCL1PPCAC_30871, partial [Pristionchus entomophagus]
AACGADYCDETQVNTDGSVTNCKNGLILYATTPGSPKYIFTGSLTCTDGKWTGISADGYGFSEASIIATCESSCKPVTTANEVCPTTDQYDPVTLVKTDLKTSCSTRREFITKRAWFNGDW